MMRTLLSQDGALSMSALYCMQTRAEMRSEFQEAVRSDDTRAIQYGYMFTKEVKRVGPRGNEAMCSLSNSGKTNKSGRVEYTGSFPNVNPLVCNIACRGMAIAFRHSVHGEAFPDLLKKKAFMFETVLRKAM